MAAQMSRQLTGRYFEGVWHTSVVCFGIEVGRKHHIDRHLCCASASLVKEYQRAPLPNSI